MKAKEWATRQKDAAGELAAIAKAKEVLESGVKVFLQVSLAFLIQISIPDGKTLLYSKNYKI